MQQQSDAVDPDVEHLSQALIREYLNKKGFANTLTMFDQESVGYHYRPILELFDFETLITLC